MNWFSERFDGWVIFIWPDGGCCTEKFDGWVIRMGPKARRRPDPYVWSVLISDDGRWLIARDGELIIPLSDDGEFGPVSTQKLSVSAVRTALDAARSLRATNLRWRHKEKLIMPTDSTFCVSTKITFTGEQSCTEYDTLEHLNKDMSPQELIDFVEGTVPEVIKTVAKGAVANIKKGIEAGDIAPAQPE